MFALLGSCLWLLWTIQELLLSVCAVAMIVIVSLRIRAHHVSAKSDLGKELSGKETIAFFHPYAHAGGGGERVLWCCVRAVQQQHPGVVCVIYTGDKDVPPSEFLAQAKKRFGVEVDAAGVRFAILQGRRWVDAVTWPRFTLLGQSIGSVLLGWEALCLFRPGVYIDSMGYAFTLPLFCLLGGCRVGCYVHYPTISTDMLQQVRSRGVSVCNDASVAKSPLLSAGKLLYYRLFALMYGLAGKFSEVVLVNSSWTRGHIDALWNLRDRTCIAYPPCDTAALASLPLERAAKDFGGRLVLSLAQFRPEKNHPLQLRAFSRFLEKSPSCRQAKSPDRVRLVVAGGCRDEGDRQRVAALQKLCEELGLQEEGKAENGDWDVSFRTNVPLQDMHALLAQADIGLHTMRDEHFGISVVEFMAAGAVVIAHNSAGPAMDIVTPLADGRPTGFLAEDEEDYAKKLEEALTGLSEAGRLEVAKAAREAVRHRFSQEAFEDIVDRRLISRLRPGSSSKVFEEAFQEAAASSLGKQTKAN
eukprot:TRINITY_DN82591_c0_g1_i1.p1 TRINITY_DN82591_c0_g1~~TRINITY_DN82591_c0_g1_i1.p1  ORF type:complete len:529 (-),score=99.42 TRINITY_DN82591_c0_g1_i1:10-1596(-)